MFEPERLRALAQAPAVLASACAPHLEAHAAQHGIDTPLRRAHLMAQLCHESGRFSRLTENLNYSAGRIAEIWPRLAARAGALAHNPEGLANAAYGGKIGNGDEASGDGWRFRGRGLIQLTGRANYLARGTALGIDLIVQPDLAAEPEIAVRLALSFWDVTGCNRAADRDDVEAVTRAINGGVNGLAERRALTDSAKTIFV